MPRTPPPLTDARFRNLKPKERPYEVSDGGRPGLRVEVTPTGAKIWRFRYVLNGRREKLTIGPMGLAAARKRYDEARELIQQGISPASAKQVEKERNADKEATVAGFFEHRFLPDHLAGLRSRARVLKLFERDILPKLGSLRVDAVTVEDIERILDGIRDKGHNATAILVRAWASSFFELAVDRRRITANPVKQIRRKRLGVAPSRTRRMSGAELGLYVRALRTRQVKVSDKNRLALEFILLTACRRIEAIKAQWADVNVEAGVWRVPAENQKTKKEHVVHLSDRALEVLAGLRALSAGSPWVLPAERDPDQHLHPEVLNAARTRLVRSNPELAALPHFTTHDGRRAFSSWAHDQLEHPDVIEACLAHVISGVRGIYAHPEFGDPRRRLMQAWANHLHVVAQGNVIPIRGNVA